MPGREEDPHGPERLVGEARPVRHHGIAISASLQVPLVPAPDSGMTLALGDIVTPKPGAVEHGRKVDDLRRQACRTVGVRAGGIGGHHRGRIGDPVDLELDVVEVARTELQRIGLAGAVGLDQRQRVAAVGEWPRRAPRLKDQPHARDKRCDAVPVSDVGLDAALEVRGALIAGDFGDGVRPLPGEDARGLDADPPLRIVAADVHPDDEGGAGEDRGHDRSGDRVGGGARWREDRRGEAVAPADRAAVIERRERPVRDFRIDGRKRTGERTWKWSGEGARKGAR